MKRPKQIAGLLALALGSAGIFYGYETFYKAAPAPFESSTSSLAADSQSLPSNEALASAGSNERAQLIERLATQFIRTYGNSIEQLATQAKLYSELEHLLKRYPQQGYSLFEEAVGLAFPALRDAILSLISRLSLYHRWVEDNYRSLQDMTPLDREASLWQKRTELFGEDARQIWVSEETLVAQKQRIVKEEIQRLDQAFEITPEETAFQIKTLINETYGGEMAEQVIGPDVMATTLFSLESVQHNLQALPQEEQQARINDLRKQMGFPDEAIEKLAKRDQKRAEDWQKGYDYMEARRELSRRYTDERLEQKLDALRQEHFGRTAETIEKEESSGFFRYERPRRLGLN